MIIILDGWGEQIPDEYNGIHVALTPTMDALKKVVFGCPCSSVKILFFFPLCTMLEKCFFLEILGAAK